MHNKKFDDPAAEIRPLETASARKNVQIVGGPEKTVGPAAELDRPVRELVSPRWRSNRRMPPALRGVGTAAIGWTRPWTLWRATEDVASADSIASLTTCKSRLPRAMG